MKSLLRIYAVITKELRQLRRDRMTFGMVVMIPFIQLMLFGYAINTNIRHIPAGLVDQSRSSLSRQLAQTVAATQVLAFTARYADVRQAEAAIASGEVRAALVIPADIAERLVRHPSAGLPSADRKSSRPLAQWLVDGADPVIAGAVKSLRNMPLAELLRIPARSNPPTFEVTLLYNPEQRTAVNTVPGIVAVILTMTMIMFTSAAIVRESERGNMEMLITTPVRPIELMLGKIVPYMFIGGVQVTIILGLGHLIFKVPINGSLIQLAWATLLFIAASLTLGLVISTIAKNQLQSMQMTIFVLLPSILLSGFMFPYEGMPVPAQRIAEILPATHFIRLIRGVVLRDVQLLNMPYDIAFLAFFIVFGLTVASLRFKKRLD
ncbi:ABC transporter permease [Candidatus Electronema sp. PJ]|uniref:ABC transporter permease n=1 Tax=Candidatus Electronema sp. PJ TaxID=3401572 RepID=UPI003AA98D12